MEQLALLGTVALAIIGVFVGLGSSVEGVLVGDGTTRETVDGDIGLGEPGAGTPGAWPPAPGEPTVGPVYAGSGGDVPSGFGGDAMGGDEETSSGGDGDSSGDADSSGDGTWSVGDFGTVEGTGDEPPPISHEYSVEVGHDGSGELVEEDGECSIHPADHAQALLDAWDRVRDASPDHDGSRIDIEDFEAIRDDEGAPADLRAAARFFLANPAFRHVLERGGESGDDNDRVSRDDLETAIAALRALDWDEFRRGAPEGLSAEEAQAFIDRFRMVVDIAAGEGSIDGDIGDGDRLAFVHENACVGAGAELATEVTLYGEDAAIGFEAGNVPAAGEIERPSIDLARVAGDISDVAAGGRVLEYHEVGDRVIVTGSWHEEGDTPDYGGEWVRNEDGDVVEFRGWVRQEDGTIVSVELSGEVRPGVSEGSRDVRSIHVYDPATGTSVELVPEDTVSVAALPEIPDEPEGSCGWNPVCHGGRFASGAWDRVVDDVTGIGTFLGLTLLAGGEGVYAGDRLISGDYGPSWHPPSRTNPYVPTVHEFLGTGQFGEMLVDGVQAMPGHLVTGTIDDFQRVFSPSSSSRERGYGAMGLCELLCTAGYGASRHAVPRINALRLIEPEASTGRLVRAYLSESARRFVNAPLRPFRDYEGGTWAQHQISREAAFDNASAFARSQGWTPDGENPHFRFVSEREVARGPAQYSGVPPGYAVVDIHGMPRVFASGPGASIPMTAARLARQLRAQGWDGRPIFLVSCSPGACVRFGRNAAQKLADELGVPVVAADETVWAAPVPFTATTASGRPSDLPWILRDPDLPAERFGEWHTFYPRNAQWLGDPLVPNLAAADLDLTRSVLMGESTASTSSSQAYARLSATIDAEIPPGIPDELRGYIVQRAIETGSPEGAAGVVRTLTRGGLTLADDSLAMVELVARGQVSASAGTRVVVPRNLDPHYAQDLAERAGATVRQDGTNWVFELPQSPGYIPLTRTDTAVLNLAHAAPGGMVRTGDGTLMFHLPKTDAVVSEVSHLVGARVVEYSDGTIGVFFGPEAQTRAAMTTEWIPPGPIG